jgi:uncharacterized protein YggE
VFARVSLGIGLLALTTAVLTLAPIGAAQPAPQPPSNQGVSVVGSGIVLATPNTARITLGVEVFDASLAAAQADASRRMDAVIAQLRSAGIPESDIRTVSFNIRPQYDSRGQNQSVLRGYQIQNLVEVKSTNVGGLGPLLDSAVGAGATRVYGIRFEADNIEALKTQARDQAMQNARAKAEQLARNAGVALGRPIHIQESDAGGVTPVGAPPAWAEGLAAPVATPIQPGELQVQTIVHVTWAIQ